MEEYEIDNLSIDMFFLHSTVLCLVVGRYIIKILRYVCNGYNYGVFVVYTRKLF